ncbi:MAG: hypothetical protein VX015_04170 [Planctomycetota bacterium]|nr:hypothetical protein [Planctomycetota bacterium]
MKTRIGSGPAGSQRGVALMYAVFGTFVVASMVSVMFAMASVSDRQSEVKEGTSRARLLAEGALAAAEKDLRVSLAAWREPATVGQIDVGGAAVDFEVSELGAQQTFTEASGIVRLVQPYEIETRARAAGASAAAHRIVNVEWMPLFQFAVFYGDDLEIHAGPDMTLRGRVHSNADMYLGGESTITFDTNYVRAVGDIYRAKKNGNVASGNVDIRKYVENPFDASEPRLFERMLSKSQLAARSISGYDSAFRDGYDANGDGDLLDGGDYLPFEFGSQELWGAPAGYGVEGATVMTGQHGIGEAVTPEIGSIQLWEETAPGSGEFEKGYYHANAGLAIVVDEGGQTFTATDAEGNDVTDDIAPAVTLTGVPDMRQSDSAPEDVPVIQIDVAALAATGFTPGNGLIYAAHEGTGTGTEAKGVLLTNGAELPTALTVASQGPVYVHGDYNTTDKKGAAVIGDAINLLSNAWDGTKSPGRLPRATETTFNFAMITGSYESEPDRYNGGLENLPRFHERWSGVPCNISGSFVNIYDSQHATGDWRYGSDRYTAPIRNWQYDESFNSLGGLPPFTPMAVSAAQVVSW